MQEPVESEASTSSQCSSMAARPHSLAQAGALLAGWWLASNNLLHTRIERWRWARCFVDSRHYGIICTTYFGNILPLHDETWPAITLLRLQVLLSHESQWLAFAKANG